MNETLRAKWIQADTDVAATKRRFDLATENRLAPQRAIEIFRAEIRAEQERLDTLKRTREAAHIEEQRETKREFDSAERAYTLAQRALVRAERELAEDSENARLVKERAAAKEQREVEQAIWDEGKRQQKLTEMETKARYK